MQRTISEEETSAAVASLAGGMPPVKEKRKNKIEPLEIHKIYRIEQINDLPVTDMRYHVSKLTVKCFFSEFGEKKPRGMWQNKRPDEWPASLPFQDPNNNRSSVGKLKKTELVRMLTFLICTYRSQNGLPPCDTLKMSDQPYGSNTEERLGPSQPSIDPGVCTSLNPGTSTTVSSHSLGAIPALVPCSQAPQNIPGNPRNVKHVKSRNFQNVPHQSECATSPANKKMPFDIVRRLTDHVNNEATRKDCASDVLLDPLRGFLDVINKIMLNKKPINKLLHDIEYFIELDDYEKDEHDKKKFVKDISKLESFISPKIKMCVCAQTASKGKRYRAKKTWNDQPNHANGYYDGLSKETQPAEQHTDNDAYVGEEPLRQERDTDEEMEIEDHTLCIDNLSQDSNSVITRNGNDEVNDQQDCSANTMDSSIQNDDACNVSSHESASCSVDSVPVHNTVLHKTNTAQSVLSKPDSQVFYTNGTPVAPTVVQPIGSQDCSNSAQEGVNGSQSNNLMIGNIMIQNPSTAQNVVWQNSNQNVRLAPDSMANGTQHSFGFPSGDVQMEQTGIVDIQVVSSVSSMSQSHEASISVVNVQLEPSQLQVNSQAHGQHLSTQDFAPDPSHCVVLTPLSAYPQTPETAYSLTLPRPSAADASSAVMYAPAYAHPSAPGSSSAIMYAPAHAHPHAPRSSSAVMYAPAHAQPQSSISSAPAHIYQSAADTTSFIPSAPAHSQPQSSISLAPAHAHPQAPGSTSSISSAPAHIHQSAADTSSSVTSAPARPLPLTSAKQLVEEFHSVVREICELEKLPAPTLSLTSLEQVRQLLNEDEQHVSQRAKRNEIKETCKKLRSMCPYHILVDKEDLDGNLVHRDLQRVCDLLECKDRRNMYDWNKDLYEDLKKEDWKVNPDDFLRKFGYESKQVFKRVVELEHLPEEYIRSALREPIELIHQLEELRPQREQHHEQRRKKDVQLSSLRYECFKLLSEEDEIYKQMANICSLLNSDSELVFLNCVLKKEYVQNSMERERSQKLSKLVTELYIAYVELSEIEEVAVPQIQISGKQRSSLVDEQSHRKMSLEGKKEFRNKRLSKLRCIRSLWFKYQSQLTQEEHAEDTMHTDMRQICSLLETKAEANDISNDYNEDETLALRSDTMHQRPEETLNQFIKEVHEVVEIEYLPEKRDLPVTLVELMLRSQCMRIYRDQLHKHRLHVLKKMRCIRSELDQQQQPEVNETISHLMNTCNHLETYAETTLFDQKHEDKDETLMEKIKRVVRELVQVTGLPIPPASCTSRKQMEELLKQDEYVSWRDQRDELLHKLNKLRGTCKQVPYGTDTHRDMIHICSLLETTAETKYIDDIENCNEDNSDEDNSDEDKSDEDKSEEDNSDEDISTQFFNPRDKDNIERSCQSSCQSYQQGDKTLDKFIKNAQECVKIIVESEHLSQLTSDTSRSQSVTLRQLTQQLEAMKPQREQYHKQRLLKLMELRNIWDLMYGIEFVWLIWFQKPRIYSSLVTNAEEKYLNYVTD